jgi:hypothetical protein
VSLRSRHLACIFLLLSTLGAAQADAARLERGFYGHSIAALLFRNAVDARSEAAARRATVFQAGDPEMLALTAGSRAVLRCAWTMRPPASRAADVAASTSFARTA